jgi:hypothetical protein
LLDPILLTALAISSAFAGVVILFTAKSETALRFCAAASLLLALCVPVTRLAVDSAALRLIVPAALLFLTALIVMVGRGIRLGWVGGLGVVYLAAGLLIALTNPASNAMLLYSLTAVVLVCGLVQGNVLARTGTLPWLTGFFVGFAVLVAGYAIAEALLAWQPLWRGGRIMPDGMSVALSNPLAPGMFRAQAVFAHPLPLALILVVALYLRLKTPSRSKFWSFLSVLTLLGGIAASGSRNALVIAAMVLVLVWAQRLRAMRVPVILAAVVGGVVAILLFLDSDITGTGSFTHRIGALEAVGRLLTMRTGTTVLFGSGEASLPTLYSNGLLQSDGLAAVDNQLVYQLATTGVVGAVLIAAIGIIAFRRASTTLRGVLLILLLSGLIFDLLAWPATAYLAWLVVGAAVATPTVATPSGDERPPMASARSGTSRKRTQSPASGVTSPRP